MKSIKWAAGLCLAVMSTFAFGGAASAPAAPLLFKPNSGAFPYHLAGTGGESRLETVGGTAITSTAVHALAVILNSTLFDLHLEFLKAKNLTLGTPCFNDGTTETILVSLIGHLGLADPGDVPAIIALVPSGFSFTCSGIKTEVRGEVIGKITAPAVGADSEELTVLFNQSKGKQEFTTFLLNNETLVNQFEESKVSALGAFEQSGQQSVPTTLKSTSTGQGLFLLVTP